MVNDMKKIPVGYEDIREIIDKDLFYIDKTLMIRELLDRGGKVSLFTRPRRFGKTLNLSMLRRFFELDLDEIAKEYRRHSFVLKACNLTDAEKKRFQAAPIAAYYHFLAGKAAILLALVKETESLGLDGEIFSDSFGAHIPDSLHAADSLLTECEMNLFHFLEDLLHRTDSHVKDFREKTIKDMSKSDLARYAKAYAEYTVIFSREPYSAAPSREAGTSSGPASAAGRRTPELSKGKSIL